MRLRSQHLHFENSCRHRSRPTSVRKKRCCRASRDTACWCAWTRRPSRSIRYADATAFHRRKVECSLRLRWQASKRRAIRRNRVKMLRVLRAWLCQRRNALPTVRVLMNRAETSRRWTACDIRARAYKCGDRNDYYLMSVNSAAGRAGTWRWPLVIS